MLPRYSDDTPQEPGRCKQAATATWNFAKTYFHPISNGISSAIGTGVNALGTAMKFINPQYEPVVYSMATFINPVIGRTVQAKVHPEGEIDIAENRPTLNAILHGVNTGLTVFGLSYTSAPIVAALGPGWPALVVISVVQTAGATKAALILDKVEQVVPGVLSATKQCLFSCKNMVSGLFHRSQSANSGQTVAAVEERTPFAHSV